MEKDSISEVCVSVTLTPDVWDHLCEALSREARLIFKYPTKDGLLTFTGEVVDCKAEVRASRSTPLGIVRVLVFGMNGSVDTSEVKEAIRHCIEAMPYKPQN